MVVEIDVRVEVLSVAIFMGSAADVVRVVAKIGHAGHAAQQREEFVRPNQAVQLGVGRSDAGKLFLDRLAPDLAHLVARILVVKGWKFLRQTLVERLGKEIIEHQVGKGAGAGKLLLILQRIVEQSWI